MRPKSYWLGLVGGLLAVGCGLIGPSSGGPVDGRWSASPRKGEYYYEMSLRQSGDKITGEACGYSTVTRTMLFHHNPVIGDYPRLSIVVTTETADPAFSGKFFRGHIDSTRDIVVDETTFWNGQFLRFSRATNPRSCLGGVWTTE